MRKLLLVDFDLKDLTNVQLHDLQKHIKNEKEQLKAEFDEMIKQTRKDFKNGNSLTSSIEGRQITKFVDDSSSYRLLSEKIENELAKRM